MHALILEGRPLHEKLRRCGARSRIETRVGAWMIEGYSPSSGRRFPSVPTEARHWPAGRSDYERPLRQLPR